MTKIENRGRDHVIHMLEVKSNPISADNWLCNF